MELCIFTDLQIGLYNLQKTKPNISISVSHSLLASVCKFVISRPVRQALLDLVQQALLDLVQQALLDLKQYRGITIEKKKIM